LLRFNLTTTGAGITVPCVMIHVLFLLQMGTLGENPGYVGDPSKLCCIHAMQGLQRFLKSHINQICKLC